MIINRSSKLNLTKLVKMFLPFFWQNEENNALTKLLTVDTLDVSNTEAHELVLYAKSVVGYSVQRKSLETSLNSRFGEHGAFAIQNNEARGSNFVFWEDELNVEEVYIGDDDVFVFNLSEQESDSAVGFTVFVPESVLNSEIIEEVRAWIERVQIVGTTYEFKIKA